MEAAARESAVGAGSAAWEIVNLGENTWEVVVGAPSPPSEASEGPPVELRRGAGDTDERLAAVERKLAELSSTEQRVERLEIAQERTEERLEERDAALLEEIGEIYREAERTVAAARPKRGWRERRHELKLAKLQRDSKIRDAEDRIESRAAEISSELEDRTLGVLDGEDRLTDLMDQIAAAEERIRSADDRALMARHRLLGPDGAIEL